MKKTRILILGIIIGVIATLTVVVYASNTFNSKDISYTNESTNVNNVSDAVDELYDKYTNEKENISTNYFYHENILNGAYPVLSEGLIPVKIADDGKVTKASINEKWYSYAEKKWANAIILNDGVSYKTGETIKEEDIQSYFVWIPRYKYQLFYEENYSSVINEKPTTSNAKEIKIVFESKNTTPSNGSTKGSWLTHPAFTNFNTNGMWVGKFETTGTKEAITVKPGLSSLRNINIATMFKSAYNYKRDLDSHMMKNTEWGAVAYLSHSKYGINEEININNSAEYKTGYSSTPSANQSVFPGTAGTDASTTQAYNTEIGYKASTTGNTSGIYDMSGGAYEYVAGYRNNTLGSSGLTEEDVTNIYKKYFDVYNASSSETSYNYRILGDATGEMGPFYYYADEDGYQRHHNSWYSDFAELINSSGPWFRRGGDTDDGVLSGEFYFTGHTGEARVFIGFRLVLTV